ncbi:MAG: ABC transporter permease [Actinobacteria bacterium]|nr:MAG: ABC transporter permease [Actinomycetota bacterium]
MRSPRPRSRCEPHDPPADRQRGAPLGAAHRAPARADRPGADLPDVPARGELERPPARHQPPPLPYPLVPDVRARDPLHAGRALLGDERRNGPRVETGFLNRLALTPLSSASLLTGLLGGALVLGIVQAVVYLTVGVAAGASFAAGFPGVLVIVALSMLLAIGFGCIGLFVALRTGSGEAVQSMFPVFFVFLFLSSMNLPRNLIQTDWFREVATYNPVSYLIEAIRSLLIKGWDGEALALGFGIAGVIAVVAMVAASTSMRTRLVRT